jgi:arylsulfatase
MQSIKTIKTILTCLVLTGLMVTVQAQNNEKPNVVLMLADNVGWGDIGCYGGGEIRGMPTPRIDKLASEGMQMTQFLVEPGCTPSRAALMLGRMPIRAGLSTIIIGGTPNTLQDSEVTMAELFKSQGYATGMTGKWHLGSEEQSWPTKQGFDEYKVGVIETTDGTLYRRHMERQNIPEEVIAKVAPKIWESDENGDLKPVREYTVEYRSQVESDIADASIDYIKRKANKDEPFFLFVGWTHAHYPNIPSEEFVGKAGHPYGDALMELDYRTGQVLDALKEEGIEDNTIVIWISDNANGNSQTMPQGFIGANNGPFRGELGDALEGSLRVPGMIKWPGKIPAGKKNGMISIQDFFPTLATIIGAEIPKDRPMDGIDQADYFLGKQENSNREHLITFVNNELAGVRWRQYRMYPKPFVGSFNNPSQEGAMGNRVISNELLQLYNIELDPREQIVITADNAWVFRNYLQIIGQYKKTLEKYPNPPGVSLTSPGL